MEKLDVLRVREDVRRTNGGNPVQEVRFHVRNNIDVIADYRQGGKKSKSLILNLHGLLCSKKMAEGIFVDDASKEYSILNIDLVGYGKSSRPKDTFGYTMEEQAEVLAQVLDQIAYNDITIYAHSMSGPIGVYLAEKLLNEKNGKTVRAFKSLEGNTVASDCGIISRTVSGTSVEKIANEFLPGLISRLKLANSMAEQQWGEEMKTADPEIVKKSAISLLAASEDPNMLERFIALQDNFPVTYVWGENSDQYKASESQLRPRFEAKGIKIVVIPGVGHFVHDSPQLWSLLI